MLFPEGDPLFTDEPFDDESMETQLKPGNFKKNPCDSRPTKSICTLQSS